MRLPWQTKKDLRQEIEDLHEALEQAKQVNTQLNILRAGGEPDGAFIIEMGSRMWPLIAEALHAYFVEQGAKNYLETKVEFTLPDPKRKSSLTFRARKGLYVMTMQNLIGKTPSEMQREAEAERDKLLEENRELKRELVLLRGVRPMILDPEHYPEDRQ